MLRLLNCLIFTCSLMIFANSAIMAQELTMALDMTREETLIHLNDDIVEIHKEMYEGIKFVKAMNYDLASLEEIPTLGDGEVDSNFFSNILKKAISGANKLKVKYQDNPYIMVTGFKIEIGILPAISYDFKFK